MKRHFVFASIIFLTTITVFAQSANLTESLRNCSPYTESGNVNTEGMNVQSTKQITGKDGDKCVYKETVNMSGMNVTITCRFTDTQRYELASVMDAYALVQKYSKENVDTSSISSVQNNPVVKAWNRYLQDSSVCTMDGIK